MPRFNWPGNSPPADSPTPSATATATSTLTPAPQAWYDYPIIPAISDRARAIFAHGRSLGNTPNAFSVIGDCEGIPSRFLGVFDSHPSYYRLGEYAYLQRTIEHFRGYFGRISRAAHDSFTTSSVLSPLWAHPAYCLSGETPLGCELRINRPSFALVTIGTMDYLNPPRFEPQMRIIIETLIQNGTVPILYTKASNYEGNWSINAAVGRLAYEYDVPLWNFWRAVQPLPSHGLQADGLHLTWAYNYFDDPWSMQHGWPWRNLTALQALDAAWLAMADTPPVDLSGPPAIGASG
ncbi:MAG: SGNH/GDSL hydrolase family protein [Anaerolineales bacterium]|nr:SGNH/GDSL hydrolase family protein [Anaerolineales bacterium]